MKRLMLMLLPVVLSGAAFAQALPQSGTVNDIQWEWAQQTTVVPLIQMVVHSDNPQVVGFRITLTFNNGDKPLTKTIGVYEAAGGIRIAATSFLGRQSAVASITFEDLESVSSATVTAR